MVLGKGLACGPPAAKPKVNMEKVDKMVKFSGRGKAMTLSLLARLSLVLSNWLGRDLIRESGGETSAAPEPLSRHVWMDMGLIALLQAVMTWAWLPDLRFLLAMISGDDSLVMHTLAFVEPERFAADISFIEYNKVGLASFLNIIPILAYKNFGIDPQNFFIFFLYLQAIFRPVGVYFACYALTRVRGAAWIAAFLLEIFSVRYNLAYYNIFFNMPYVGNMALLFVPFSAGCFFLRRNRLGWLFHSCCSFVHMALGLMWGGMLFCFFALRAKRTGEMESVIRAAFWCSVVFLLSCLPVLFLGTDDLIPIPEPLKQQLLHGGHAAIWRQAGLKAHFWSSFVFLVFLSGLLLVSAKRLAPDIFDFVLACTIVMALTCAAQLAAVHLGYMPVVKAIFTRSSFLYAYIFSPILVALLWKLFLRNNLGAGLVACTSLIFLHPSGLAAGTSLLLAMSTKRKSRVFFIVLAFLLLFLSHPRFSSKTFAFLPFADLSFFLGTDAQYALGCFFPPPLHAGIFFLLLILSLFWLGRYLSRHTTEKFKLALTFLLVAFCLFSATRYYSRYLHYAPYGGEAETESRAYWAAQEWAAANTVDDASFIVVDPNIWYSWRTLTRRPMIGIWVLGGLYGYWGRTDQHNRRLAEWVGRHIGKEYLVADWPYTKLHGRDLMRKLNEGLLSDFADAFGGDYVVAKKTSKEWALPLAYENEFYRIYALSRRARERLEPD